MLINLCIKIFIARLIDVGLSTFVTVLTVKGRRFLATILGFIDVVIWFVAVKEALSTDIKSIWIILSYAGGYAIGTFIGTTLCNILIKGKVTIQIIIKDSFKEKIAIIRSFGYAVTTIECMGMNNEKKLMLLIQSDKKKLNNIINIIKSIDEKAYFVVNETKYVENGFFS